MLIGHDDQVYQVTDPSVLQLEHKHATGKSKFHWYGHGSLRGEGCLQASNDRVDHDAERDEEAEGCSAQVPR